MSVAAGLRPPRGGERRTSAAALRHAAADRDPRRGHRNFSNSLRPQRHREPIQQPHSDTRHVSLPSTAAMGFSIFLDDSAQACVTRVVEGGAADIAGIYVGCILLEVDGTSVEGKTHEEALALIVSPLFGTKRSRTFCFAPPPRNQRAGNWQVPAFKGELGHLHVSQRHKAEGAMRRRTLCDVGDENPDAVYCA